MLQDRIIVMAVLSLSLPLPSSRQLGLFCLNPSTSVTFSNNCFNEESCFCNVPTSGGKSKSISPCSLGGVFCPLPRRTHQLFLTFLSFWLVWFFSPRERQLSEDSLYTLGSCGDMAWFNWWCYWFQLNFLRFLPEFWTLHLTTAMSGWCMRSKCVGKSLPRITGYGNVGANATDRRKVWLPTVRLTSAVG